MRSRMPTVYELPVATALVMSMAQSLQVPIYVARCVIRLFLDI